VRYNELDGANVETFVSQAIQEWIQGKLKDWRQAFEKWAAHDGLGENPTKLMESEGCWNYWEKLTVQDCCADNSSVTGRSIYCCT